MHQEELWNGVTLQYRKGQFPLGTDSVACAGFADFPSHSRIADLGCGTGAIALMLLACDSSLHITGIELRPEAVSLARENAGRNNLDFIPIEGDLRRIRTLLPAGSMDGCISNPPYFPVGSGAAGAMSAERSEENCTLSQLTSAAAWLLRTGGRFVLVHRPERLADLFWELRGQKLEPKRIGFVRHRADGPVSLVLLEARKGGRPGLRYEPDLVLYHSDGTPTAAYQKLYHKEE